jgi:hypothetical protein
MEVLQDEGKTSIFDGKGNLSSVGEGFKTRPIDGTPEATIMFADISGFYSMGVYREPVSETPGKVSDCRRQLHRLPILISFSLFPRSHLSVQRVFLQEQCWCLRRTHKDPSRFKSTIGDCTLQSVEFCNMKTMRLSWLASRKTCSTMHVLTRELEVALGPRHRRLGLPWFCTVGQ